MVNAFGFGGANYVALLESCRNGSDSVMAARTSAAEQDKGANLTDDGPVEIEGVSLFETNIDGRPFRLGVLAKDDQEAMTKVLTMEPIKDPAGLSPKTCRFLARRGIFSGPSEETSPAPAFVFAGQGSQYPGMGSELYRTFPVIRKWMDRIARVADFDILDLLFRSQEDDLQKTRWQQPALFTMEYAMARCLMLLGIRPVAMAGHSLGELTALCLAGVFSWEDGFRIINKRARCMDKAAALSKDPGAMIAVDAPLELVQRMIEEGYDVFFTNFNSPRQVVLGGGAQDVLALMEELQKNGYWSTRLNVSMAFHSPLMKVIHHELEAFISDIAFHPPRIPVISNTSMEPFPDEPGEIKKIVMAHLESPVHWMQNVKTLWGDYGIRLFVEIGPRDTLCSLIAETLEQAQCIHTCHPGSEAHTFQTGAARLFSLGHLRPARPPIQLALPGSPPSPSPDPVHQCPTGDPATIVQQEINTFVLENFGRSLKPRILSALRREIDPAFSEDRLEALLGKDLTPLAPSAIQVETKPSALPPGQPAPRQTVPDLHPLPDPGEELWETPVILDGDYLECVIGILMDATGYERDEIEPDMDIRQDLAIRSSRLPVIMDAAERRFGITINIEDFMGLRTVREIADQIAELAAGSGSAWPVETPAQSTPLAPPLEAPIEPSKEKIITEPKPLKRLLFNESPVGDAPLNRLKLKPGQEIAILSFGPVSNLSNSMAKFFRSELNSQPFIMDIMGRGEKGEGYDLRAPEGAERAARRLAASPSLAGLILVMGVETEAVMKRMEEIPALLTGFFRCMKSLMRSSGKEFCFLLQQGVTADNPAAIAGEGVLGMFLSAAQEYRSVLFRSMTLDTRTDLKAAMDRALDTRNRLVQFRYRGQRAFTPQFRAQPAMIGDEPALRLGPEDVVLISGGGRSITAHLVHALSPFGPRLVLLGRTVLDPSVDYERLLIAHGSGAVSVRNLAKERKPDLNNIALETEVSSLMAGMEVTRNLRDLKRQGLEAIYHSCDVAESDQVTEVVTRVIERYGKIDGVIHGAGVVKDSFMEFMTAADFAEVVEVKLRGALNLYEAARGAGLRFMVGLSSAAAVLGNAGQVNYCAANRAMSAFFRSVNSANDGPMCKALMLPPIDGTGMAQGPEVKELMRLKGLESAYVHVKELAQWFCRELFITPADQSWVMLARDLPRVNTSLVDLFEPDPDPGSLSAAGLIFRDTDLPMIQAIDRLDLKTGELVANRTFSLEYDLWIHDHKPFKFLKHPLVSGIMAVETFLEAAHLLYPHLSLLGIRQVSYSHILECPPGLDRNARIVCRHLHDKAGEVICEVSLSSPDVSPSGRLLDRWSTNYQGEVILGRRGKPPVHWPEFQVSADELDTRPVPNQKVQEWYEKLSHLKGRYQLVRALESSGPGVIVGNIVYQEGKDFAGSNRFRYRYSPYLLETLIHMMYFYVVDRDEHEKRNMIPSGITEMRFYRNCRPGERVIMEARLQSRDNQGLTWNARAVDETGVVIMQVSGVRMNWFTQ